MYWPAMEDDVQLEMQQILMPCCTSRQVHDYGATGDSRNTFPHEGPPEFSLVVATTPEFPTDLVADVDSTRAWQTIDVDRSHQAIQHALHSHNSCAKDRRVVTDWAGLDVSAGAVAVFQAQQVEHLVLPVQVAE